MDNALTRLKKFVETYTTRFLKVPRPRHEDEFYAIESGSPHEASLRASDIEKLVKRVEEIDKFLKGAEASPVLLATTGTDMVDRLKKVILDTPL